METIKDIVRQEYKAIEKKLIEDEKVYDNYDEWGKEYEKKSKK